MAEKTFELITNLTLSQLNAKIEDLKEQKFAPIEQSFQIEPGKLEGKADIMTVKGKAKPTFSILVLYASNSFSYGVQWSGKHLSNAKTYSGKFVGCTDEQKDKIEKNPTNTILVEAVPYRNNTRTLLKVLEVLN